MIIVDLYDIFKFFYYLYFTNYHAPFECVCANKYLHFFQRILDMGKAKVLLHDYKLYCCSGTQ